MKNKKSRIIVYILALIPAILLLSVYGQLPEQVPTSYGFDGSVSYSGKSNLWAMALMGPVFAVMFDVLPKIDPRRKNYKRFGKYYDGFCIFLMVFLIIVNGIIISECFQPGRISVSKVVMVLLCSMFIFMGNMMPKVKSNFYFGFKTPWTISDEDVWNKTHRLGGQLFFWGGIVLLLCTFFLPEKALFAVTMVYIMVAAMCPGVMSYVWYQRKA